VQLAWLHVPAAASVASVVVAAGSLRVQEIARVQGGLPWDWLAFRSPAALAAFGLLLACASIDLEEPRAAEPASVGARLEEEPGVTPARRPSSHAWLRAASRAHRILLAGLASTLFLGGWLIPGVAPAEQDARLLLELAGAVCLLAKTGAVVVAIAWARWALPPRHLAERARATAVWLAPLGCAVLAATAAWTWWSPARPVQALVSDVLVAGVALAALALAVRLRHGLLAATGDGRLSPFL
jgi:NADH-quinone oxidoreductase subunit H